VRRQRIQAGMRFRAIALSALALGALAGCGSEDEPSVSPAGATTSAETRTVATVPATAPAVVKVYFLRDGKVVTVGRGVVAGPQIGRAAVSALLEGPNGAERAAGLRSAIPQGTEIGELAIGDGVANIAFTTVVDPSATAQIVYTLTQFATVKRVSIGGDNPLSRADLEDFTPPVLVESPLPGEEISSPLRIKGTANTFEATFNVEILGADRRVLGETFVTATSGSGTRGTFDASITFAAVPGPATLVVFERSAEDGTRIHEVEIPLQVAP
jgi:germination protein M